MEVATQEFCADCGAVFVAEATVLLTPSVAVNIGCESVFVTDIVTVTDVHVGATVPESTQAVVAVAEGRVDGEAVWVVMS